MALILILIVLLMSGLIVPPFMGSTFSGVRSANVNEDRALRFYAADAGIENALYQIKYELEGPISEKSYTMDDINQCDVDVTISHVGDAIYRIFSTATGFRDTDTIIESVVTVFDYAFLFDYAIATKGNVNIRPGAEVTGDVRYEGELDNKGNIDGELIEEDIQNWPTADQMREFYLKDVEGLEPYGSDTIDIGGGSQDLGPLFRDGNLLITGMGGEVHLTGTIYVTGDLMVEPGVTVRMSDEGQSHTMFAEGLIDIQPWSYLYGPGCIIAIGDIVFKPNLASEDFIFVMSIEGSIDVQPNGDFYGTLAAAGDVTVKPGGGVFNPEEAPEGLNFPDDRQEADMVITSYNVSQ